MTDERQTIVHRFTNCGFKDGKIVFNANENIIKQLKEGIVNLWDQYPACRSYVRIQNAFYSVNESKINCKNCKEYPTSEFFKKASEEIS